MEYEKLARQNLKTCPFLGTEYNIGTNRKIRHNVRKLDDHANDIGSVATRGGLHCSVRLRVVVFQACMIVLKNQTSISAEQHHCDR